MNGSAQSQWSNGIFIEFLFFFFFSSSCDFSLQRSEATRRGRHLSLMCQSIQSLQDLYGFFSTLSIAWPPYQFSDMDKEVKSCLSEIESVLTLDFLEKMPQSLTSLSSQHSLASTPNGISSSSSIGSLQSQQTQ